MARVVSMFIERLPEQVSRAQAAAHAGNLAEVAEFAHWLKGSAGSVGLHAFTEPAATLEAKARDDAADMADALRLIVAMAARIETPDCTAQPAPHDTQPAAAPIAAISQSPPTAPTPLSGCAPVRSSLAGSPRMQEVVHLFVERLQDRVLEMRAAGANGDLATLAQIAHWLKGSAGSVGYMEFTEPAQTLEALARAGDAGVNDALELILNLAQRVEAPRQPTHQVECPPEVRERTQAVQL